MIRDVTVEDKLWGVTRCIYRDETHEAWHASIKEGGYSSRHYHRKMPNKFYVISGTLRVEVVGKGSDTEPQACYDLGPGQELTVDDTVWHRFVVATKVEVIEFYWSHLQVGGDIVRSDFGGIK